VKLKTLMIIKAIVCLVLGVPILLVPVFLYSLFGVDLNPAGVFPAQEYGASLMGNLMLTWFARDAMESEARRAIIIALCVYDAVGFVITLIAQFTGVLGPLGWMAVLIYLFFAVAFGYFLLPRQKTA